MLFNVIPVLLIFISVAIIAIVIARRLPDIASLNLDSIPEARSAAQKRQLLIRRLERRVRDLTGAAWAATSSTRQQMRMSSDRFYKRLVELEAQYRSKSKEDKGEELISDEDVSELLKKANEKRASGRSDEAEKLYLEVIRRDHRNVGAYKGLGLLYGNERQYEEARQALEYAVRLDRGDPSTFAALGEVAIEEGNFDLALGAYEDAIALAPGEVAYRIGLGDIYLKQDNINEAIATFREAVGVEPSNPRCLDRLLEVSILGGNKMLARTTLKKLAEVNPENKKLEEFGERIKQIKVQRKRNKFING